MKIIIPMAGRGSRLRPHTLTVPKPLMPIAGKPIVQRLVEDIANVINQKIDEVAFIIGDFGAEVEADLMQIAQKLGAKGSIYHQTEPLGTAHAIMCAKDSLQGNCVVAFADTLFKADFTLDANADGVIWVKQVADPSAFGVVKLNEANQITDFVEKPKEFVSDLAIIGIYYFKEGELLRDELQYLLDNKITKGGEYQLTDGLENMKQKGKIFVPGTVKEWMDCGNKDATVDTNKMTLTFDHADQKPLISNDVKLINSKIIEPCYIGKNVLLTNSTVGPHVTLGDDCVINNATLENCLIQNDTKILNTKLQNSMLGSHVHYDGEFTSVSLGDYSVME